MASAEFTALLAQLRADPNILGLPSFTTMREAFENMTAEMPVPLDATCEPFHAAGLAAEWIRPVDASRDAGRFLATHVRDRSRVDARAAGRV